MTTSAPSATNAPPTLAKASPKLGKSVRSLFSLHSSYSVPKFLALIDYLETRSLLRKIWIVLTVPMPGLLAAIVPIFLPLQAPSLGPNWAFQVHSACIIIFTTYGTLIYLADTVQMPRTVLSHREIIVSSICCTGFQAIVTALVTTQLVFPVPFQMVVTMCSWVPCLTLSLVIVLGSKLWRNPVFRDSFQPYRNAINIQSLQLFLYPAISVLYDHVDSTSKAVIVVLFPGVKYILKRLLYRVTEHMGDNRSELVVSGIEICSSLYQSMIIQTMPSLFAMVFVLSVDVVMSFVSTKLFLDRYSEPLDVPRHQFFSEAARRLQGQAKPTSTVGVCSVVPIISDKLFSQREASIVKTPDKVVVAALGIADSAERILLMEYYEVVIPVINSIFLFVATQFPSAQYNPRLAPLYYDQTQLHSALQSIWLYSFLQFLSWIAMHLVMKYRYGVSAISHLAFILERHWFAIVGKLIPWLPVILHFTLVQYGFGSVIPNSYINEISPPHMRNRLGSLYQISLCVFLILVGATFFFANTSSGWRYIGGFPVVRAGQQLSGIDIVFLYSSSMFKDAGLEDDHIGTMVANVVYLLPTLFAGDLGSRFGNRRMILFDHAVMIVASIGIIISLLASSPVAAIIFTAIYVAAFATSLGPLIFVMITALFPDNLRASGTAVCLASNWFGELVIGVGYPYVSDALGDLAFLPFAFMIVGFGAFMYKFLPDTAGKTNDEVQDLFRHQRKAQEVQ
ncbi:hypothetical protein Poli38472_011060 [Pythium oligandrum]|uniref:Hexose transporter 1 n=1 Tax=Pythium oligandrum TaxID=41045 RepID=A0A8K1FKS4_PYTOL|nr:hypothetical protein Poli38472_011060 [Pythium oligandrum]|eukprot:TMW67440.1 hypothetical protein Poli38472_011060 [Pythium oligandrum]